jgi:hypothetical protein
MSKARLRLIIAAVLFCGWLGFLAFLAATASQPVILSRPQFLGADAHVVVQLTGGETPDNAATIERVFWSHEEDSALKDGLEIDIMGLEICHSEQGWQGPGAYLLPLKKGMNNSYHLYPVPITPGYSPKDFFERFRIYPATSEALRQLQQLSGKE